MGISLLCPSVGGVESYALLPPLFIRTPVLLESGSTLLVSFNHNFLFRGPISKRSHIRTLPYNFWGQVHFSLYGVVEGECSGCEAVGQGDAEW